MHLPALSVLFGSGVLMQALEIDIGLLARCLSHLPLEQVLQLEEQQDSASMPDARTPDSINLGDSGKSPEPLDHSSSLQKPCAYRNHSSWLVRVLKFARIGITINQR